VHSFSRSACAADMMILGRVKNSHSTISRSGSADDPQCSHPSRRGRAVHGALRSFSEQHAVYTPPASSLIAVTAVLLRPRESGRLRTFHRRLGHLRPTTTWVATLARVVSAAAPPPAGQRVDELMLAAIQFVAIR